METSSRNSGTAETHRDLSRVPEPALGTPGPGGDAPTRNGLLRPLVLLAAPVLLSVPAAPGPLPGDAPVFPAAKHFAGERPAAVAVGDLDGDGLLDLVVASQNSDEVTVLLSRGDGGFLAPQSSAVGDAPTDVVLWDLDGDGLLDVVLANRGSDDVSVLLGQGGGTLGPEARFAAGDAPLSVAVADLNGDGVPDLVVANGISSDVSVLLGSGGGAFAAAVSYGTGGGLASGTHHVSLGDLNGDSFVDVVVADTNRATLSVFLGVGDGTLGAPATIALPGTPSSTAIEDLDQNGIPDLIVGLSQGPGRALVLLGVGDGTFGTATPVAPGARAFSLAVGDLDGDGLVDLVVGEQDFATGALSILLGGGDGSFALSRRIEIGKHAPSSVVICDVDANGLHDLAAAVGPTDDVVVLLGSGPGSFQAPAGLAVGPNPNHAVSGDFDGDGLSDLAVAIGGSFGMFGGVAVLLGSGGGGFSPPTTWPAGDMAVFVAVGDLDGDAALDLVVANLDSNSISVLLGAGDGTFPQTASYAAGTRPRCVAIADLDLDGTADVVVANHGSHDLTVLLGTGGGALVPITAPVVGLGPIFVAIGDLNADGVPDLAVANSGSNTVSVLLGVGDGTFTPGATLAVGSFPLGIAIEDLDGDGNLDLAVANAGSNDVTVLLGIGGGAFGPAASFAARNLPQAVAAGDVDGDGVLDLVVPNYTSDDISVLRGVGDGTFRAPEHHVVGAAPQSLALADLDGNQTLDAIVPVFGPDEVRVLFRRCDEPTTYCTGAPNSTGAGARIGSTGSQSVSGASFALTVADAPPSQFGMFFYGSTQMQVSFGDGFLCVDPGGLFRLLPPQASDSAGALSRPLDFSSPPAGSGPGQIAAGSTWNFQFWYRDSAGPGGTGFNLSNGLSVPFCP